MPATLFIGAAACGKTHHVLDLVRAAARDLNAQPVICVPTTVQRTRMQRRLARHGGVLGVRVLTFDTLYTAILASAPSPYVELDDPVQYRLMRDVIETLAAQGELVHYAPIAAKPGFIAEARRLVAELKGARVDPAALQRLWSAENAPPRLQDLARIYAQWQARLIRGGWVDLAGIAWLAVEELEQGHVTTPAAWSPLVFDGFDSFTEVQLAFVRALAAQPGSNVIVTLTGDPDDTEAYPARTVHRRFHATRRNLEAALGVAGVSLPVIRPDTTWRVPLLHLRNTLLTTGGTSVPADDAVEFIEASSRALEVRAALRWLKLRIVRDGVSPAACALVARSMQPYRQLIDQIAAEFGLPVHIEGGLPLASNPAIATILQLLHLLLPDGAGNPILPRRPFADLWRSPYLDLSPFGVQPGDADLLEAAGRIGLVASGVAEWRAALAWPEASMPNTAAPAENAGIDEHALDEPAATALPRAAAQRLAIAFDALVARLTPLPNATVEGHVRWLEGIIGDDMEEDLLTQPQATSAHAPASLNLMAGIKKAQDTARRDGAAMRSLKEVMRGLIWAEEIVGAAEQSFAAFVADLAAAVEAASFTTPDIDADAIFVGDTIQVRGAPFALLAVMGMAEGELPSPMREDPFLHEDDRLALRTHFPGIKSSIESTEAEFFLDTVARPQDALLVVRPRISDTGAAWEPSLYWQDLRARLDARIDTVLLGHAVAPTRAASKAELLEALAAAPSTTDDGVANAVDPADKARVLERAHMLHDRAHRTDTPWDGDLRAHATAIRTHFGPSHVWSATAVESYIECPLRYFMDKRLQVEPRNEPEDGPGAAEFGTIYHSIMHELYAPYVNPAIKPPLDALLNALPTVAAAVLDAAPAAQGFRTPPSWQRKREEIEVNVRRSVVALDAVGGVPIALEYHFGGDSAVQIAPPLTRRAHGPAKTGSPSPCLHKGPSTASTASTAWPVAACW